MKNSGSRVSLLIFTAILFASSFFTVDIVVAKDDMSLSKGLAMSPIRNDLKVSPGDIVSRKLTLINYSGQLITVTLNAEEFSVVDTKYDYAFNARSDLSKWVTFENNPIAIQSGKTTTISYTVTIPKNAEPGGRYLSLFASIDPQTAPGELRTEQRIASLVYLTVKGNVTRTGELQSLTSPTIFDGYQPWSLVVANSGTAHFRSNYSVSIRNIFDGKEIVAATGSSLILPRTARAITAPMAAPKYIGVYRAVYTVGLGDSPPAMREYYVFFLPKQLYVSLISLLVIVTGFVGYGVWKLVQRKQSNKSD